MHGDPLLELTDASVFKNGIPILDRLTLTIRIGEHTAIVGPNGAGKSTLINVLTRVDYPLAPAPGAPSPVRIFGESRWDIFDLRSRLGIVSADLHTRFVLGNSAGDITGIQAVLSGFFATQGIVRDAGVPTEMRRAAVAALALMEADHLSAKPLGQMSTGEARRVLIARALVSAPSALILDEPTTGLDMVARQRFLGMVSRIARGGTTIVLVTHHVEEIVPEIDRVILLDHGRVVISGPKRTVLTGSHLSSVYAAPITLHEAAGYYYAHAIAP